MSKPNRLAREKSPYLLQHANNPVDWYPWGEEAFAAARAADKPIFLSVGYSTCHWCHVMERESFEKDAVAEVMNDLFINVKVDREERTDVDRVYMAFVQGTTGSGGWPMSVWLTPELKPFYGGTYYPPDDRYGRPGFASLCKRIGELWTERKGEIRVSGDRVIEQMQKAEGPPDGPQLTDLWARLRRDRGVFETGYRVFLQLFDDEMGGFGKAPKFPRPVTHNFLFRHFARGGPEDAAQMVLATNWHMANGGMYDHLGGGFHRYSVDRYWHVPHFEKMLYDQAQLVASYVESVQVSGDQEFGRVARATCDYVLRDLTDQKTGGFFSAEDADSLDPARGEKREGAFYVFTQAEIDAALDERESKVFSAWYGARPEGNADDPHGELTGRNVLHVAMGPRDLEEHVGVEVAEAEGLLASAAGKMLALRNRRPRPHLDDKILTAWNGMMIGALARAHQVLGEPRYLEAATRAAEFAASTLWDKGARRLWRRYRDGEAAIEGYLDDYAQLAGGLIDLYEAGFDPRWLLLAEDLAGAMVERFEDAEAGGFYATSGADPSVLLRLKDDYDGAEPSGNSMAALALLRLGHMLDRPEWIKKAQAVFRFFSARLKEAPHAMPQMLVAVDFDWEPPMQIVIAGERGERHTEELLKQVRGGFVPHKVVLLADERGLAALGARLPWFAGMGRAGGAAAAYVCRDHVCERPVTMPHELAGLLQARVIADATEGAGE